MVSLLCSMAAAFVLCAIVASCPLADAGLEPSSTPELCTVELFQSGFGVTRGSASNDFDITNSRTLKAVDDEQTLRTTGSVQQYPMASLCMKVVAQVRNSEHVGWVVLAVGIALLALAQAAILYLGPLPPPRVSEHQSSRFPAASVFIYTGIVRVGVLANYTIILPFAASVSTSSGQGSDDSGYLIGVTSAGSVVGLLLFWLLLVQRLRLAYMSHGVIMFLGNSCWAWAAQMRSFTFLTLARLLVGLEAGVSYNTSISTAHHARGDALTTCFFVHQFCQDAGVLLGPVLAAVSTWVVKAYGSTNVQLQEGAGNLLMALWGVLLVAALFLQGPLPDPPEDERGDDSEVQGPLQSAPEARALPKNTEGNSEDSSNTLGLQLFITETAYLRHAQRILFESGMIYILQMRYQWAAEESGLVMLPAVANCAILEIILVAFLKWNLSGKSLIFVFEAKQLLGCLLMLYGAQASSNTPVWLIAGGVVAYGGNALCGAAINSLCVKRSVPTSIASRDALMMSSMVGVFAACFTGALASRVLLGESPSPYFLVLLMLGTCCCQFIVSLLTLEIAEFQWDRWHAALVLGVAGVVIVCAFFMLFCTGLSF